MHLGMNIITQRLDAVWEFDRVWLQNALCISAALIHNAVLDDDIFVPQIRHTRSSQRGCHFFYGERGVVAAKGIPVQRDVEHSRAVFLCANTHLVTHPLLIVLILFTLIVAVVVLRIQILKRFVCEREKNNLQQKQKTKYMCKKIEKSGRPIQPGRNLLCSA